MTRATAALVREVLDYNPGTGVFVWRKRIAARIYVGDVAGTTIPDGYVRIKIERRAYGAHRLAWVWMMGGWPIAEVDHIDGDRANNKWENLRLATDSLNSQNRRAANINNRSGLLGVSLTPSGKFSAQIRIPRGPVLYLGTFKTGQEAHAAYIAAKRQHHDGCTI